MSKNFWLTLNGATSGKGSGYISITVAPNAIDHRRTAYVKVGRNEVAVLQGARIIARMPDSRRAAEACTGRTQPSVAARRILRKRTCGNALHTRP